MTPDQAAYTGVENLEVMREARKYNAWLLRLIRAHAPERGRVIDFGAGSGTFARPLQEQGLTMTCVEPDAALGGVLRAQGLTPATALDQLEDASFDFAYTLNVLEHIQDDAGALSQLRAKLKPGARLLVYVPAFQILYGPMDRKVGHLRRYRRRALAQRVRAAGFTVETARYADSLGFFAALAFRLLRGESSGELNPAHIKLYDRVAFPLSRALDAMTWPLLGKNVIVLARR
jgi:SAM-dependent methyltransferase